MLILIDYGDDIVTKKPPIRRQSSTEGRVTSPTYRHSDESHTKFGNSIKKL